MTTNSKILIVDDDRDLRNLVRLSLENGRRVIREASTALDGLRCANEVPPDILLLDIGLPGQFNGFSLCESLCKDPRHHALRVVVISGHGEAEDLEQAKRLGVVAYIVKPFSQTRLVTLIDQLENQIHEMVTIVS
ncbi:MAG: response regulator [Rhodocyclaceae bacterium]|nr:MAG: response regulator [Rhodocyclaceae bacterium]